MFTVGHLHRLGVEVLPVSSNSVNFSVESESFNHGLVFRPVPEASALGSVPINKCFSNFEKSSLKDIDSINLNSSSSTRDIHFKPDVIEEKDVPFQADFGRTDTVAPKISQEADLTPKGGANVFAFNVAEPSVDPFADDGKVRLNLQCSLTETVLISEKSSQVDKFEFQGVASGTITNHRPKSLLDEADLHGHVEVKYDIGDPRSVIKSVVSGSKAVSTNVIDNAELNQKQVNASIDCKDINAFITKSKANHTTAAAFAIPSIPIFKYALQDNFRPVVMKTKQILSIVEEGKIHIIVHVLFNTKVLTGPTLKEGAVQVSCSPLGAVASVDCSTMTVASTSKSGGVGKFQASNKVITWSFGMLQLKEQPAISMEATIELTSPADASNGTVNAASLPSIYLPMIVKGVSDGLLSNLTVDVSLPDASAVKEAEILFPGDAPSASSTVVNDDNVLIHEIVEFRKQTKLECRFL